MVDEVMKFITEADPEVGKAIEAEAARQRRNLELIASENIVSEPVMMAMGSVLTNKYAEGYPGKRYYGGCQCVDVVESIAIERAKKLFGCDYANVQPHSGAQANMAVFIAMLKPGDTVMGMNLDHGGHLTHGSPVNFSGLYFNIVPYGVDDNGVIDYEEVERIALEAKPKLIIAGASAYAREIDFKRFREIADKVGAYLMVDMAHIAGLVAAGLHQSPIPYADVVTTTTHKTLRGPRGGLILANKEAAEKFNFNKAIFPGTQGGPLEHIIAGKAVCFGEALKLTPWETFAKNLALLPMAFVVWWRYRPDKIFAFKPLEIVLTCTFFFLSMYLGYYCYIHLPLIDFLPYKVGVNIHEAMQEPAVEPGESETVLIYRNRETGREREFSLDDTEWQDAEKWEWVDTRTTSELPPVRPLVSEFALRDADGDATEEVLTMPGRVYMLCVTELDHLPRPCARRMARLVEQAREEGAHVICLTPDPLYGVTWHDFGSGEVRCYNIDASTMKTMLRAYNGLVVLDDGTITAKRNCRDIRP